ncbi:hypothetical protein [Streptomyces sp. NPDC088254]|uniref:hypothetical protein n=1 Tax=Streptomyces sp. NPDC088254 TaxID=3365847 RepID=UPI0037FC98D6
MIDVPDALATSQAKDNGKAGRAFIAALPTLAAHFLERWDLRLDGAPMHGRCALVLPVTSTTDGTQAALKLQPVDDENAGEPVALRTWAGRPLRGGRGRGPACGRGRGVRGAGRRWVRRAAGVVRLVDPGFDLWPALADRFDPADVRWRFDAMTDVLSLDRARARAWTLARILQNALWDIDNGDRPSAQDLEIAHRLSEDHAGPGRRP